MAASNGGYTTISGRPFDLLNSNTLLRSQLASVKSSFTLALAPVMHRRRNGRLRPEAL